MSNKLDAQSSFVKRIVDGSVTIDSVEEFENIAKIFPDDARVYRAFADVLAREKSFDAAVNAYRKATELFVDSGMLLQAIVSKISEWRIVQPTHEDGYSFYSALVEARFHDTMFHNFVSRMTYAEMVAFVVSLIRVRFPVGKMVKRFEDVERNIYFVVSGALKETTYYPLEEGQKVPEKITTDLVENDFFGDIYPFEERIVSQSDVEAVTRVELMKISKDRLMTICRKHPNVEYVLKGLYQARSESKEKEPSRTVRRTVRHQLPTKVKIKIFPKEEGKNPFIVDGFTEDISLGGTCVMLGAKYRSEPSREMMGKSVKVEMNLPKASVNLSVLGTIVWSKEVIHEGEAVTAVGIQFREMVDGDRKLLEEYCYGSDGEQNLIWNLWESLVNKQGSLDEPKGIVQ